MVTPERRNIHNFIFNLLHLLQICEFGCVGMDHHDTVAGDVGVNEAKLMEKGKSFRNLRLNNVIVFLRIYIMLKSFDELY